MKTNWMIIIAVLAFGCEPKPKSDTELMSDISWAMYNLGQRGYSNIAAGPDMTLAERDGLLSGGSRPIEIGTLKDGEEKTVNFPMPEIRRSRSLTITPPTEGTSTIKEAIPTNLLIDLKKAHRAVDGVVLPLEVKETWAKTMEILPDPNQEPTVAPGTPFINIDIDGITYNMIFLQSTNRIWCKETPTGVKLIKVPR